MDYTVFATSIGLFGRRILAALIDIFWLSSLCIFYLIVPIFAALAYNLWEPSQASGTTTAGIWVDQLLQLIGGLAVANIFFCQPALAMTRLRRGTPGQILTGTTVTSLDGERITFGRALIALTLSYALFTLVAAVAASVAASAAGFIPALGYASLRELTDWALVAVTFAIALVSERRQDLYELASRRLFTLAPDSLGVGARLKLLLPSLKRLWWPGKKTTTLEKCAAAMVTLSATIGTISGITLGLLAASIIYAIVETEKGMACLAKKQETQAAAHFHSALSLCPGASNVYNQFFLYSEGQAPEQLLAADRIVALRGDSHAYLMRARLEARESQVSQAASDYHRALACQKDPLSGEERALIVTELSLLEFKAIQL